MDTADFFNMIDAYDIPDIPAVRGNISRSWRLICHGRKGRRETQRRAQRRMRRAVRQALHTGERVRLPRPLSAWDIT